MDTTVKNQTVRDLNLQEMQEINGGGKWHWQEALMAYGLLGLAGVGFYTIGTMQ